MFYTLIPVHASLSTVFASTHCVNHGSGTGGQAARAIDSFHLYFLWDEFFALFVVSAGA
jgi:hypothetical protein